MKIDCLKEDLNIMIPNPRCELEYTSDVGFLISVMLSAQCTDKRVNMVTSKFFSKYSFEEISNMEEKDIQKEIRSLGNYHIKAYNVKHILKKIISDHNLTVPNDREYLLSLPGVGNKTVNVVLSELFNVPTIAVDTHVERVSKRLGLVKRNDNISVIERKLKKKFAPCEYNRINHQLLLLGRYVCLARNPKCNECKINGCPFKLHNC